MQIFTWLSTYGKSLLETFTVFFPDGIPRTLICSEIIPTFTLPLIIPIVAGVMSYCIKYNCKINILTFK